MTELKEHQRNLKILIDIVNEIFFDYCKVVLGNKLFDEVDKLRNSQSASDLLDAFSSVESQISQRKELIDLIHSAKETELNSSDPCIVELKAKLFDMLMSIHECNKVDSAIKSNTADQLKEKNDLLNKKLQKLDSDIEKLRKVNELLRSTNKSLEQRIDELQSTIRRIKPYPTSIEDFIRINNF